MAERFAPGAVIERREVVHGSVWLSTPVTVVADDGEILAVRLDPGAPMTCPPHPFGPHPWAGTPTWGGTSVLQLYRADDWYAVWRLFEGEVDRGWYVNFEAPIHRTTQEVVDDLGPRTAAVAEDLDAGRRWWSAWDGWTPSARP